MKFKILTSLLCTSILGLTACGGGGGSSEGEAEAPFVSSLYTGSESATTMDGSNSGTASQTAIVGAERAIIDAETGGASSVNPFFKPSVSIDASAVAENSFLIVAKSDFSETEPCPNGGTIFISSDDIDENSNSIPSSGSIDSELRNCNLGFAPANGRIQISWTGGWDLQDERGPRNTVISYNLTLLGETSSGIVSCQNYGETCTAGYDFEDGNNTYRIEDPVVSGDEQTGYDVSTRVFRDDLGFLDIEGTDLVPCSVAGFSEGTIEVSDATGTVVATLTFIDCNSYQLTFGGETITLQQ